MLVKTVNTVHESWNKLKFWDYYFKSELPNLEGLPSYDKRFSAFSTPADEVKVVILGQDPYPTRGHANGLAFSVYPHITPVPRSLGNIFTEYSSDLSYPKPRNGDLSPWAQRGVLLLNTCLSVGEGQPGSHRGRGWEKLTYEVLKYLNTFDKSMVYCLWGRQAQEYAAAIDNPKHNVLRAAHPSPLSASQGFFGCRHFSQAAEFLGVNKDIWKLP